jgi:hypothetical protein
MSIRQQTEQWEINMSLDLPKLRVLNIDISTDKFGERYPQPLLYIDGLHKSKNLITLILDKKITINNFDDITSPLERIKMKYNKNIVEPIKKMTNLKSLHLTHSYEIRLNGDTDDDDEIYLNSDSDESQSSTDDDTHSNESIENLSTDDNIDLSFLPYLTQLRILTVITHSEIDQSNINYISTITQLRSLTIISNNPIDDMAPLVKQSDPFRVKQSAPLKCLTNLNDFVLMYRSPGENPIRYGLKHLTGIKN